MLFLQDQEVLQKSYSGGKAPRPTVAIGLSRTWFSRLRSHRLPAFLEPLFARVDGRARRWYLAMVQDVVVNGETHAVEDGSSVADLLQTLGVQPQHVAVERNREIVPRATFAQTPLAPGDRVEIVTFVGGG